MISHFAYSYRHLFLKIVDTQVVQVSEKKVLDQKAYMLFYYRDKRNVASKKPLDAAQKEIISTNVIGKNKIPSNLKQEVVAGSDGGSKTKVNYTSSAEIAQRDLSNAAGSMQILSNDAPNQNNSSSMKTECSVSAIETLSELYERKQLGLDSVKGSSTTSQNNGEHLQHQDSSVMVSSLSIRSDNVVTTTSHVKLVESDLDRSSNIDAANIVPVQPGCSSIFKSTIGKDLSEQGITSANINGYKHPEIDPNTSIARSPDIFIPQCSHGAASMTKNPSGEVYDALVSNSGFILVVL